MKQLFKYLALPAFAAVCLVATCSFAKQGGWYAYESKAMGFKISFPPKPAESSQMINSDMGELKLNIVGYDASADSSASNFEYMVDYTAYPDTVLNSKFTDKMPAFFRGAIDGMAKNVQGKILSEKISDFKSYPGREVKIDLQGQAVLTCRCYLINSNVYIVMAISATGKDTNTDITKFFNSFDLE